MFIILLMILMLCTVSYPIFASLLFGGHIVTVLIARSLRRDLIKRWIVGYLIAAALLVALVFLLPAHERGWTASISGIGSGTQSVNEVRYERFNLSMTFFQAAASFVLLALATRNAAGRYSLGAIGGLLIMATIWGLSWQI